MRMSPLSEVAGLHTRICRPVGLGEAEVQAVVTYMVSRVGYAYDLKNVFDLARYLVRAPTFPDRMKRRMLAFGAERATELLEAAGAHTILTDPLVRESGWHLMGTARMGDDPAQSVVDRWGRAHDVPNLYIIDGSIWPTSAGMNPTATIAALALRITDHLIEERRGQKVPL